MIKAGTLHAHRGVDRSNFGTYLLTKTVLSQSTAKLRPRVYHAVIRLAERISVHNCSTQKAFCSPMPTKSFDVLSNISIFDGLQPGYGRGNGPTSSGTVYLY